MLLGAVDAPQEPGAPTSLTSGALTPAPEPFYELSGVGLRRQPAEKALQLAASLMLGVAVEPPVSAGTIGHR
jgi:hypothetical protein